MVLLFRLLFFFIRFRVILVNYIIIRIEGVMLSNSLQRHGLLWRFTCKGFRRLKLTDCLVVDISAIVEQKLFKISWGNLASTLLDQLQCLSDFCDGSHIGSCKFKRLTLLMSWLLLIVCSRHIILGMLRRCDTRRASWWMFTLTWLLYWNN